MHHLLDGFREFDDKLVILFEEMTDQLQIEVNKGRYFEELPVAVSGHWVLICRMCVSIAHVDMRALRSVPEWY